MPGPVDAAALSALEKTLMGTVVKPGDPSYDEDRTLFNSMVDKTPALIVKVANAADVASAIGFARDQGLELGVRSGGHGVTGACLTDGLVIDMRAINDVVVDPDKKVARVGGGASWGDVDRATQEHGLATTSGRVSTTGVAGLTLSGGSGWFERKLGLACDRLIGATLVTASGETVHASATENPDLLWALKGGGGNFGVATELEFRLDDLGPEILVGLILYPPEQAEAVARNYRDFLSTAPDELGGGLAFLTAPPEEFVPEDKRGTVSVGVIATWCGDVAEGQTLLSPILDFGEPHTKVVMPAPYVGFQSMLDDPPGFRNYWTAEYLDELPDEALDLFCEWGRKIKPSPSQFILLPWGGAVARVGEDDTPMTKRKATWVFHPLSMWEDPAEDDFWISHARASAAAFRTFTTGGVYLNFIGDEGEDRIVAAFGKDKYERLAEIKATYDPDNVFRGNQNIKPRAGASA